MAKIKDLKDKRFGKLTVVSLAKKDRRTYWNALCECGSQIVVDSSNLTSGNTKSCGCGKIKSEVGKKYGRLEVQEFSHIDKWRQAHWRCICDCGTQVTVNGAGLRKGSPQSCGCYRSDEIKKRRVKDEVGNKYGQLTVVNLDRTEPSNGCFWKCRCDCGNTTTVRGDALRGGRTKSCGCYNSEQARSAIGPKSKNWKGGKTPIDKKVRNSSDYADWRISVFERDDYTCRKCNVRGADLNAHHIFNFATHSHLRVDINNGITMCKSCHDSFHAKYGKSVNDRAQILEFIR